jgi:hypothetical protein
MKSLEYRSHKNAYQKRILLSYKSMRAKSFSDLVKCINQKITAELKFCGNCSFVNFENSKERTRENFLYTSSTL